MPNPTPPESSTTQTDYVFSPLTRLNLFVMGFMFLLYVIFTLTEFMPSIVAMLAASLIVTYLLLGPVHGLEKLLGKLFPKKWRPSSGLRRILAIGMVYLLCLGLFTVATIRVVVPLSIQIKEFTKDLPTHWVKANTQQNPETLKANQFKYRQNWLKTRRTDSAQRLDHHPKARLVSATKMLVLQKLAAISKNYATRLGHYALDIGTSTVSSLVYILTTLVLVFYLLLDGQALKRGVLDLMPGQYEAFANQFLTRLHNQFYTIIKGQVLMSFLSGGLVYCVLLIIGVKYALLLGVVLGCVSILPVIGPWLGLLPIIVVVETSGHPIHILPVFLVAGSFYLLKSYWLWPKLISRKFEVHPILFIITFLACIQLMGFPGIFLSFPLASILGVWTDFQKARHRKTWPIAIEAAERV
jgi:predicted PurR-regulated permease PerM